MLPIHNNIAISGPEYKRISKINIGLIKSSLYNPVYNTPPNSYALSVVLADNTHDNLSHLNKKSGSLEDDMLTYTKVLSDPFPLITDTISSVGQCFEYKDPMVVQDFGMFVPENAPFDIPNNNEKCFIRDCF